MPEELTPDQLLDKANLIGPMSLAAIAYSQLDAFYQREAAKPQGNSAIQTFCDTLQGLAIRLIRMSVYLEARAFFDEDHTHAVKAQNKVAEKVRKALGFSYSKQDINF